MRRLCTIITDLFMSGLFLGENVFMNSSSIKLSKSFLRSSLGRSSDASTESSALFFLLSSLLSSLVFN
jgi:hypothetical protein